MKKKISCVLMAMFAVMTMFMVGCSENYSIMVSNQFIWYGLEQESQTIDITANCEWTITKNDDSDWYTISAMSGKGNASLTITVEALNDADYRGASFVISSPGGHVHHTIFVSQNKLDFDGMVNKVFGVMSIEHWITDYYGQIIEEEYRHREYDPFDTTTGFLMYFFENGRGVQRAHYEGKVFYFAFNYEYNPINQVIHFQFEQVDNAPENYTPDVLTASDTLFRFFHEYQSHRFELVDMRKIGVLTPEQKSLMMNKAIKRKKSGPIFVE